MPKKTKPKFTINHTCAVCILNDGNYNKKLTKYCSLCGEYICKKHWAKWGARAKAAWKKLTGK